MAAQRVEDHRPPADEPELLVLDAGEQVEVLTRRSPGDAARSPPRRATPSSHRVRAPARRAGQPFPGRGQPAAARRAAMDARRGRPPRAASTPLIAAPPRPPAAARRRDARGARRRRPGHGQARRPRLLQRDGAVRAQGQDHRLRRAMDGGRRAPRPADVGQRLGHRAGGGEPRGVEERVRAHDVAHGAAVVQVLERMAEGERRRPRAGLVEEHHHGPRRHVGHGGGDGAQRGRLRAPEGRGVPLVLHGRRPARAHGHDPRPEDDGGGGPERRRHCARERARSARRGARPPRARTGTACAPRSGSRG